MHDDLADIILFAALSGIRQGRILALKSDDIDFENNMIRVTKPKSKAVKARYCGLHAALKPMLVRRCNDNRLNLLVMTGSLHQMNHELIRYVMLLINVSVSLVKMNQLIHFMAYVIHMAR